MTIENKAKKTEILGCWTSMDTVHYWYYYGHGDSALNSVPVYLTGYAAGTELYRSTLARQKQMIHCHIILSTATVNTAPTYYWS